MSMRATQRWSIAAAAALVFGVSFAFTPTGFPKLQLCVFRRLTGLQCPGCGLSRSFCALSHGEWSAAWGFHPFGVVFYGLGIALVLWPFVVRAWPGVGERWVRSGVAMALGVALMAGVLAFGTVRAWVEWHAH